MESILFSFLSWNMLLFATSASGVTPSITPNSIILEMDHDDSFLPKEYNLPKDFERQFYPHDAIERTASIMPLIPTNGTGYLSESNLANGEFPIEIRCPIEWIPVGPYCVTVAVAPPYTQCPRDKSRKKKGIKTQVLNTYPGICVESIVSGVNFECPSGSYLQKSINEDEKIGEEKRIQCVKTEILPFENQINGNCPLGFEVKPEGCRSVQHFAPNIVCPSGYILGGVPVSPYSMLPKEYTKCGRMKSYKGKMWCPKGFILVSDTLKQYKFGDAINENPVEVRRLQSIKPAFDSYFFTRINKTKSGRLLGGEEPPQPPTCIQALAVPYHNCNSYQCKNEYTKELLNILENWVFYRLQGDPVIAKDLIPNGKDLHLLI